MSNVSRRLRLLIIQLISAGRLAGRVRGSAALAVMVGGLAASGCAELSGAHSPNISVEVDPWPVLQPVELVDGTVEAMAVVDALNDPTVTRVRLRNDVGVSATAAWSWTEQRQVRPFESVEDITLADGVTEQDVARLAHWAWRNGYLADEHQLLGTWDEVDFTVLDAERTVDWVNSATVEVLDHEVGLDSRAVESIVAARPVATVAELSTLFWVGPDAMARLKAAALRGDRGTQEPLSAD